MSNIPAELKYSKEHEWLRKEADGTYTVGITEHAQELLGDMAQVCNLSMAAMPCTISVKWLGGITQPVHLPYWV